MSFASQIKEELSKFANLKDKESVKFEFFGYLISSNCSIQKNKIRYATENEYNINRFNKILNNLLVDYNIELQGKVYVISFKKIEFKELEYIDKSIKIKEDIFEDVEKIKEEALTKALIRGAFLGGGTLNNPDNKYHLEILFAHMYNAQYIKNVLKKFAIQAKTLKRKNSYSIYIKEAEEISKFLAFIGANKAVLNFEEVRVVRDTRNSVNRIVNCETANLNKTVNAAVTQISAIKFLKANKKFDELSDNLKEIANIRLKNPDANLIELGKMLSTPIGKSGVNHRLAKICKIAEELKSSKR